MANRMVTSSEYNFSTQLHGSGAVCLRWDSAEAGILHRRHVNHTLLWRSVSVMLLNDLTGAHRALQLRRDRPLAFGVSKGYCASIALRAVTLSGITFR